MVSSHKKSHKTLDERGPRDGAPQKSNEKPLYQKTGQGAKTMWAKTMGNNKKGGCFFQSNRPEARLINRSD